MIDMTPSKITEVTNGYIKNGNMEKGLGRRLRCDLGAKAEGSVSGRNKKTGIKTLAPINATIKKIHLQPRELVMTPPIGGEMMGPIMAPRKRIPRALPRCAGGNVSATQPLPTEMPAEEPAVENTRMTRRTATLGAQKVATFEAMFKMDETIKMGLRP